LQVQGQFGLYSEFLASLGYVVKACLKKKKKKEKFKTIKPPARIELSLVVVVWGEGWKLLMNLAIFPK
jgi:hypothetical protein